jgi:GAF domain-containing protein
MEWIAQAFHRAKCFGGLQHGASERRFDRYEIPANYSIEVRLGEHSGVLSVLSEAGACIVQLWSFCERPPVTLPVTFTLPEQDTPVKALATVCWVDSLRSAGLYFVDLSKEARHSISRFILGGNGISSPDEAPEKDRDQEALQAAKRVMLPGLGSHEFDAALTGFAETACWGARASGVAIALGDGSTFACRASAASAPPLGTEVSPDFGLFHECIRTKDVVLCADAATDLRVEPILYEQYHVRSVCMVPLLAGEVTLGCIGVFRDRPCKFSSQDVEKLRTLAQSIVYSILHCS